MMKTYVFVAVNKDKWRKKRKNFCFLKTKYVKTLPKTKHSCGFLAVFFVSKSVQVLFCTPVVPQ